MSDDASGNNGTLVLERKALPLFVNRDNKYSVGLIVIAATSALYLTSNHIHLIPPRLLPTSWVDDVMPFYPHSVWIYVSEYIYFPVIYLTMKDMLNANKYLYSFFALWLISVAIFWVWPTTYPRYYFPLPDDLDALTSMAFSSLRVADSPANCCPSLHVSSCYLSSFIFLDEQRGKFPFFFGWATLIALSTLTTKQHYLIDIATGFLMAIVCYWIFHRFVNYRTTERTRELLQPKL